jgi:hypothetical protein
MGGVLGGTPRVKADTGSGSIEIFVRLRVCIGLGPHICTHADEADNRCSGHQEEATACERREKERECSDAAEALLIIRMSSLVAFISTLLRAVS